MVPIEYVVLLRLMLVVIHSPRISHCKALVVFEIGENIDKDYHMADIFTIVLPQAKEGIEIFMRIQLCIEEMFILCYLLIFFYLCVDVHVCF